MNAGSFRVWEYTCMQCIYISLGIQLVWTLVAHEKLTAFYCRNLTLGLLLAPFSSVCRRQDKVFQPKFIPHHFWCPSKKIDYQKSAVAPYHDLDHMWNLRFHWFLFLVFSWASPPLPAIQGMSHNPAFLLNNFCICSHAQSELITDPHAVACSKTDLLSNCFLLKLILPSIYSKI